jgi:hypothetical protein
MKLSTAEVKGRAYAKFLAWVDGDPAVTSGNLDKLKYEGDVAYRNDSGHLQLIRHAEERRVFVLSDGIYTGLNPSVFTAGYLLRAAQAGATYTSYQETLFRWDATLGKGVTYPNPAPKPPPVASWDVPDPMPDIIATPQQVLIQGEVTAKTVELGTNLEYARLQRILNCRMKSIPKDGRVPHYLRYLLDSLDEGGPPPDQIHQRAINLTSLNYLRREFNLAELPPFSSPITGLPFRDYKNLVTLAK